MDGRHRWPESDEMGRTAAFRIGSRREARRIYDNCLRVFRADGYQYQEQSDARVTAQEWGREQRVKHHGKPCGPPILLLASHFKEGQEGGTPGDFEYDIANSPYGYLFLFNDNSADRWTKRPGLSRGSNYRQPTVRPLDGWRQRHASGNCLARGPRAAHLGPTEAAFLGT